MSYVLLIEPNAVLAATYAQALAHAGHEVLHVTGGQAAVEAADKRTPDVLIMELQLPAHNGIEFLHEFRSYSDWQAVPVIINTVVPPHTQNAFGDTLSRELNVAAICYKPRTSLQDIISLVRQHAHAL